MAVIFRVVGTPEIPVLAQHGLHDGRPREQRTGWQRRKHLDGEASATEHRIERRPKRHSEQMRGEPHWRVRVGIGAPVEPFARQSELVDVARSQMLCEHIHDFLGPHREQRLDTA